MGKGDTILNAVIGAVVTFVASLVLPAITFFIGGFGGVLAPVAGGATASYLQESHDRSVSVKVGAISGAIASIPALGIIALVAAIFGGAGFMSDIPVEFAGLGAAIFVIAGIFILVLNIVLSAVGGYIGQELHED